VSIWSKAGVGTSIVLELKLSSSSTSLLSSSATTPRIVFDIGATPNFDLAIPAKYVFISHGHIDHIGALFSHARAHAMSYGGEGATYFVPAQLLPYIENCRISMSALDAATTITTTSGGDCDEQRRNCTRKTSLINMNLIPVNDGDEIPLKGIKYGSKTNFFMRAYNVDHGGHPALAYIIGSRTTVGLKMEYQSLDRSQIRNLVKSGVVVTADPIERIEVAYTGDTCARGLVMNPRSINSSSKDAAALDSNAKSNIIEGGSNIEQLFQSELLFCELTYLDSTDDEERRNIASERGHMHINDLDDIFASHNSKHWDKQDDDDNCHDVKIPRTIVFYHLSSKYQPAQRAMELISVGMPRQLHNSCHVAITSLLSNEEKQSSNDESFSGLIQSCGCISLKDYLPWKKDDNS
jgi:ribonuclease BN (tRNA processing enzyme)